MRQKHYLNKSLNSFNLGHLDRLSDPNSKYQTKINLSSNCGNGRGETNVQKDSKEIYIFLFHENDEKSEYQKKLIYLKY